jgi:hypothetical protein
MITAQIICDIIQKYMGLCDDQIWIYNQRKKIPPSEGLFVVVGNVSTTPYGNNNKFKPNEFGYDQEISQMMQEVLSVNMFSYDTTAIERMPELIGSFSSIYSQQVQDSVGFRIGVVPGGVADTSGLEASAILFRQTITLKCLRAYSKITAGEYFDKFKGEVHTSTGEDIKYVNN